MEENILTGFSIEALQNGDERAFEVVFRKYYRALCYFAEKILGNAYLAEEVAGNVLLKLWQKRKDFPDNGSIKAFLYISTRNASLNQLDKETRRRKREDALAASADNSEEPFIQDIFYSEALRQIYQAIENLPDKYAKVIRMAYLEGMKNEEIAEKLNLPQSTVRNQKARGIAALKRQLPGEALGLLLVLITI